MGKKVGIITFHRAPNYGAVLQTYALQTAVQNEGYDVEVIDYIPQKAADAAAKAIPLNTVIDFDRVKSSEAFAKRAPNGIKKRIRRLAGKMKYFGRIGLLKRENEYALRRNKDFHAFLKKNLYISKDQCIGTENISEFMSDYFAVITGSDQVWNGTFGVSDFAYMLPGGKGVRKIAYAASTGTGHFGAYGVSNKAMQALRELSYISVREETSKKAVEAFCELDKRIAITLDPTLLLSRSNYEKIVGENKVAAPYIFVYNVKKSTDSLVAAAQSLSKRTDLPIIAMMSASPRPAWDKLINAIPEGDLSPSGFLALIRDAAYIVTDSFHGTVFSLHFNKKFFFISGKTANDKAAADGRMANLIRLFSISDRIVSVQDMDSISLESAPDWAFFEMRRKEEAEKSLDFLRIALSGGTLPLEADDGKVKLCPSDLCTSCYACMNSCNFGAIEPKPMADGRVIPVIDHDKCRKCGMCRKTCPILNPPAANEPSACYAAQWKDADRINSASAGIGAALTKLIISKGGCVYGAGIDKDLVVRHYRAETFEEAQRQRKSKYVHSDIGFIYRDVKEKLDSGRTVMFTGTPCQIAGLRTFLGKDYYDLYCVDIVCHGTPPMAYLEQHLKDIGCADAEDYSFRGGKIDKRFNVWRHGKLHCSKEYWQDEFYFSFMKCISMSECCYSCAFAKGERVSDITIGDFWKLDPRKLKTPMEGRISLVLENTPKGAELLNSLGSELVLEKRSFEEAVFGNKNLERPTPPLNLRGRFIDEYAGSGSFGKAFDASVKDEMREEKQRRSKLYRAALRIKRILE